MIRSAAAGAGLAQLLGGGADRREAGQGSHLSRCGKLPRQTAAFRSFVYSDRPVHRSNHSAMFAGTPLRSVGVVFFPEHPARPAAGPVSGTEIAQEALRDDDAAKS